MHFRRILIIIVALLIAASLMLPAIAPAAPPKAWKDHVTLLPNGAYLIGNPKAKHRLVEYISYTCSHCADFVANATEPLNRKWVNTGFMAIEIRNWVRDRYDITAALLARCGGQSHFLKNHHTIFAAYQPWVARVNNYEAISHIIPGPSDETERLKDIALQTGLLALMEKKGIAETQSLACLADRKALNIILMMTQRGNELGVRGTPSFLIDGVRNNAHDWYYLRPLLPAPSVARTDKLN